jgi:hypothetical protein
LRRMPGEAMKIAKSGDLAVMDGEPDVSGPCRGRFGPESPGRALSSPGFEGCHLLGTNRVGTP